MADVKRKDANMALNETIYSNMSQRLSEPGIFQLQENTEKAADQSIRFAWNRHLTSDSCTSKGLWDQRVPLTAWGSLGKAELRFMFCLPLLPSTSFWLMCGRGEAFSSFCKGTFFLDFFAVFWNGKISCLIMLNSNSKNIYLVTSIHLACSLHDLV